jgi:hypothetical protein
LYGFAAALGSLEREGLNPVRTTAAQADMKGFCFFLQKEVLPFLYFYSAGQRAVLFCKNERKNFRL